MAFDAAWYLEQYPDIAAAGIDPFQHYLEHGKKEGRFGAPPRIDYKIVDHGYDPAKETVVVVSHEASRTGAPIVALNIIEGLRTKYNVVAIMLGGGGIVDSFRKTATVTAGPIDAKYRLTPAVHPLVHEVCATYRPRYAIVNSIESREVLTPFNQAGVATVLLVHEFAAYIRPLDHLYAAIQTATEVVYSAQLVWDSTVHQLPSLASRRVHITPQGQVRIPRTEAIADEASELERIKMALRPDTRAARDGGRHRGWLGPDPQGRGPVHCSGRGGPARGLNHAVPLCLGRRRLRSGQRPRVLDLSGRADREVRAGRELCHHGRGLAPRPRV